MPVVTFTDSDFEVLETGEYRVQVTNIEETAGNFGPQLKLTLEVIAGEHEGASLWTWCSIKGGPKSKLTRWCQAMGIDTSAGTQINTDDLVGKRCTAVVLAKEKTDGSGEYNAVTDLKPNKVKKTAPAPAPKADADDDPFEDE